MAANSGHHQTVMELQILSNKLILPTTMSTCDKDIAQLTNKLTARQCFVTDYIIDQYLNSGWYTNHYTGRKRCDIRYNFLNKYVLKYKCSAWGMYLFVKKQKTLQHLEPMLI